MPYTSEIVSFWMNYNETKFVTVDRDYNLKLFYLPYFLKCEMSMNLRERLGLEISNIAFSHNEKFVIFMCYGAIGVAEIESIE